ncbi:unnamed protein product [Gongylonema pulchrum]|uniref:Uncharacterized protein n=1 Tax=Gongylonema pulchrum TaxID=637853 RepID=A0A183DAB3_9BILA|nr:unnamed protein product [Gongylonema pulchrum]
MNKSTVLPVVLYTLLSEVGCTRDLQESLQEEVEKINHNLQNINSDEAALDTKIDRRKREYDQQQKRLAKLQVTRRSKIKIKHAHFVPKMHRKKHFQIHPFTRFL